MPVGPAQININPDGSIAPASIAAVPNPAAAADFTFTLPANRQLLCITATLTTSATVANRLPQLLVQIGSNILLRTPTLTAQTATATETYTWYPGAPTSTVTTNNFAPIPPNLILPISATVASSTAGISAGDQWSAIVITFSGP